MALVLYVSKREPFTLTNPDGTVTTIRLDKGRRAGSFAKVIIEAPKEIKINRPNAPKTIMICPECGTETDCECDVRFIRASKRKFKLLFPEKELPESLK
jgi:hypothetical protein